MDQENFFRADAQVVDQSLLWKVFFFGRSANMSFGLIVCQPCPVSFLALLPFFLAPKWLLVKGTFLSGNKPIRFFKKIKLYFCCQIVAPQFLQRWQNSYRYKKNQRLFFFCVSLVPRHSKCSKLSLLSKREPLTGTKEKLFGNFRLFLQNIKIDFFSPLGKQ